MRRKARPLAARRESLSINSYCALGGLISPVLANVYLHYVLDMWFDKVVKATCKGSAEIVRYADDFVCMFQHETEANAFYKALKARLKKFGLELAEEKSRIIRFGRFAKKDSADGKTETFDFLGFTHINGTTRKGKYTVLHRTSKKKLTVKKQAVKDWLRQYMHRKPTEIIKILNQKLRGHYQYYGISGNYASLEKFYKYVVSALRRTLTRRSQRAHKGIKRFYNFLEKHPVAKPKIYVNIWETA